MLVLTRHSEIALTRPSFYTRPSWAAPGSMALSLGVAAAVGWSTLDESTFYERLASGFFGVVVDTRDQSEWDAGHIPNATL